MKAKGNGIAVVASSVVPKVTAVAPPPTVIGTYAEVNVLRVTFTCAWLCMPDSRTAAINSVGNSAKRFNRFFAAGNRGLKRAMVVGLGRGRQRRDDALLMGSRN